MAQYLFSFKQDFLFTPKNIDLLKEIFQAAYKNKSKLAAFIYNQAATEVQLQLNSCLSDYESDPLINITDIARVEELIKTAAKGNDLTMIKSIYNTQNPIFSMAFGGLLNDPSITEDAFIFAAENSSMDVVKYLLESLPKCVGQIRPTVLSKAIKDKLVNNQSDDFNLIKYLARHRFITTIEALQDTANSTTSGSIQTPSQLLIEACRKEYENSINFVLIGFGLKKPKLQSADICNIIFQFSGHSEICADLNTFGSLLFRSIPSLTSLYEREESKTSRDDQVPRLLNRAQQSIAS